VVRDRIGLAGGVLEKGCGEGGRWLVWIVAASEKTPNWRGRLEGWTGVVERGAGGGVIVMPSCDVGRDRV
jgi:hypothetical protein